MLCLIFNFCAYRAFYTDNEGKWGMRIESALAVRRVNVGFSGHGLLLILTENMLTDDADTTRPKGDITAILGLALNA